jgi:hypothetical protein
MMQDGLTRCSTSEMGRHVEQEVLKEV